MMIENRSYQAWRPEDPIKFQRGGRNNWKGKKWRKEPVQEVQSLNRLKAQARRFYPKKKFNNRFAPFAPRNTTSFIIRAKKSGGIASLVSPCPVTPAILPTPMLSPSREVLVDMAKEEWGVDGYGSMKGLIRLIRSQDEAGGGESSGGELERRLDQDLSRFEMIYPNCGGDEQTNNNNNVLENRVEDQEAHIAQLEEENLTLKERLFLIERDLKDLRRRVRCLETNNEETSDNDDLCSEKSVGDCDCVVVSLFSQV